MEISLTLEWEGLWKIEEDTIPLDIPEEEGIYMVLSGKFFNNYGKLDTQSYKLLYIGEAEKVRSRIFNHEMWPSWKENCKGTLFLKIAKCQIGFQKRKEIEQFLRYNAKPVCNEQYKNYFPFKNDIIKLINVGIKLPLKDKYIYGCSS